MATVKNTKSGTKAKPVVKKITKDDFLSAVSQMSDEEKKTFKAMMAVVPDTPANTGASTRRKVAPPKSDPEPFVTEYAAVPVPEPLPAVAVFRSKHLGFWQLLKNSYKERLTDDDFQIHAPVFAEFTDGEWSAETEEEAKLMRAKIARKRRRGGGIEVSEVPAKVVKEMGGNFKPIKSKDVTVDTPMDEVITPGVLDELMEG